ncbi:toll/interleukin-1 receptor domain-containing protein [Anabaena sp. UHCC 0399]|uniref:toll/interleukin-1 receptor domain-containing protein n=1 Tax=Anabaena sp. UHCC 0399 TaxID=3110238 RepID=UPI002B1EEF82|nr:TIR domain-containing protein [Anabaena sp. UHCC 0399]MEA5569086.1 TIR domain-containing protein [Anabaena sp. UHCC 0399]
MNEIYLSYAWKDDRSESGKRREELVDKICATLLAQNYKLIRDRNHLSLGKSIQNFMREIGCGNYVIVVISDKYLQSEYCMFEAMEIMKSKNYEQKIFPIILEDADIYSKDGQFKYINYWKQQAQKIDEIINADLQLNADSAMNSVADKIREISHKIDDFILFFADKLSIDPAKNFDLFIEQLTSAIKNDAAKMRNKKSILVAGTGNYQLPLEVHLTAKKLGEKIAAYDYNLITGGWQGVDYIVSESFANKLAQKNIPLSQKLTQIVLHGTQPMFRGGTVQYTETGINEWLKCLQQSDLVILLGGLGGTYETYLYAKQEKIPVIPIVCTSGDAKRVFDEMLQDWDNQLMGNISIEKFKSLNQYINDEFTAEDVVNDVIDMANEIIFSEMHCNVSTHP